MQDKTHHFPKTNALPSTKMPILCSGGRGLAPGKEEISFGKHNNGLPANHRACFKNTNVYECYNPRESGKETRDVVQM